ncbi:kinase-like domain-containing protein [Lasiosphaeria ovina]|uniref:non-specific serine/threonine protein kinase n=1 Tax=Lasiosphaeria ovina TaxID=92902 RepID=A0AAE0TYQ1_9PEZI|nr:kinase-like domain-containing protein [Lasiosphaeria ovina]
MSQDSDGGMIRMHQYLLGRDDDNFVWDDATRERDGDWTDPVREAGLDERKHKVFHHSNKEYLNPPTPFVQKDQLGQSGSTIVYKVLSPVGHTYSRPLALKIIQCKDKHGPPGPESNVRKLALEEVRNMTTIRHPHIVVYVASFEDYCIKTKKIRQRRGKALAVYHPREQIKAHILGIAMYPPAQCNLQVFMIEANRTSLPDEAWMLEFMHTYFGCLAQAVAYLHKSGVQIRHKDIKPENVVIDEFGLPVLTDFGLAKHFETGQPSNGPTDKTLKYADPDSIEETERDERSDIFSLGCVYLEMATVILGKPAMFAEEQLVDDTAASGSRDSGEGREFKYSESLDRLDEYLATLSRSARDELLAVKPGREASVNAVLKVLPHIRGMMQKDYHERPYAHQLYPRFRSLYNIYDLPGPCVSCEEERRTGIRSWPRAASPTVFRSSTMNSAMFQLVRRTSMPSSPVTSSPISQSPTDIEADER